MRLCLAGGITVLAVVAMPFALGAEEDAGTIALFSGEDLSGWESFLVDGAAKMEDEAGEGAGPLASSVRALFDG